MVRQTEGFLIPAMVIGFAFVLAIFDLFSSPIVAVISILATVGAVLLWRRFVFASLSPDYEVRLETATDAVRLSAARWSAIIYVTTYVVLLLSCGLGYFLGGSWATFALITMIIGLNAKLPCAIVTDWALHRFDTVQEQI